MQKGAAFNIGISWSMNSFIQEIKKSTQKSLSEVDEKLCGKEFVSFAVLATAFLFAVFHNGLDSNLHNCSPKEETEKLGLWSEPWL
jgi:hypothetical protein